MSTENQHVIFFLIYDYIDKALYAAHWYINKTIYPLYNLVANVCACVCLQKILTFKLENCKKISI